MSSLRSKQVSSFVFFRRQFSKITKFLATKVLCSHLFGGSSMIQGGLKGTLKL